MISVLVLYIPAFIVSLSMLFLWLLKFKVDEINGIYSAIDKYVDHDREEVFDHFIDYDPDDAFDTDAFDDLIIENLPDI